VNDVTLLEEMVTAVEKSPFVDIWSWYPSAFGMSSQESVFPFVSPTARRLNGARGGMGRMAMGFRSGRS
jgi:hypothetical protein